MISLNEFLLFTGSFLVLALIFRERKPAKRKDGLKYPPTLPSIPILGSIPFIKDFKTMHKFFLEKSLEFGPVFNVDFLHKRFLVLNTREAIEDAFVKHSVSFAGREAFYIEKQVNVDKKGIISRTYSDEFKRFQRLTLSILRDFGFGATSLMETRILIEVAELIEYFRKLNGRAFNPKEILPVSTSNVPVNILLGRRSKYEDGLNELCRLMEEIVARFDPALDFFPLLRYVPPHRQSFNEVKHCITKFTETVKREIEQSLEDGADDCFIRRYVEREGPDFDREQLFYTVRDFIGASIETTSTTMQWAFTYIVDHPEVMDRIQREIESVVPRERLPKASDEQRMPFTQATILEIFRLRPPGAMGLPHLTLNDTEVLGFFVPKDTVVLPNIYASHMQSADWLDPEAFRPVRFIDEDGKLINKSQPIPFSLGRRSCPGESLARLQLFLFITGILQNFTIRPPEGQEFLNVRPVYGLSIVPSPYEIRMIPITAGA